MKHILYIIIFLLGSFQMTAQDNVTIELDFDPVTSEYIVSLITTDGSGANPYLVGNSQISVATCDGLGGITVTSTNLTWANTSNELTHPGGWDYHSVTTSGGSLGVLAPGTIVELFRFTAVNQPTDCSSYECAATLLNGEPIIRLFLNGSDPTSAGMPGGGDYEQFIFLPLFVPGDAVTSEDYNAIVTCPLPISLYTFKAEAIDENILVHWITVSETENKGFHVQRSLEPTSGFETIGWMDGSGTTAERQEYNFLDEEVVADRTYFYRLIQVDFDGTENFTNIVSAKIRGKAIDVAMTPNPAKDKVVLEFEGKFNALEVSLTNLQGQLIRTFNIERNQKILNMDVHLLPAGIYFVKVQNGNQNIVKKLIVE